MMVYSSYESQILPEKSSKFVKGIVFVIIVITFFSALYIVAMLLPVPSDQPQVSEEYTVLTLTLYQSVNYDKEGVVYEFMYVSGGQGNLLQVSLGGQTVSYAAVSGAVCNPFGLEVVVYSANESMLVLHITT